MERTATLDELEHRVKELEQQPTIPRWLARWLVDMVQSHENQIGPRRGPVDVAEPPPLTERVTALEVANNRWIEWLNELNAKVGQIEGTQQESKNERAGTITLLSPSLLRIADALESINNTLDSLTSEVRSGVQTYEQNG